SGGPSGDLLLTTGIYDDPEKGPTVLHFGVNLHQPGVTIQDNWRTLGMRGTGSNDIVIENVDVADAGVSVRRPKGTWAPFFDVVTPLIWPLVCAAYLGVAESARELAVAHVQKKRDDPIVQITVGEMDTELANAQGAYDDMVATAKGLDYTPSHGLSNISYKRKTIFSRSATRAVSCAMEAVGGGSFFRAAGIERAFRDIQGIRFHPWHERRSYLFSGRIALGLRRRGDGRAAQREPALLHHARGLRAVARGREGPHEEAVSRLAERIARDEAPGDPLGLGRPALIDLGLGDGLERLELDVPEDAALSLDPAALLAGEEAAGGDLVRDDRLGPSAADVPGATDRLHVMDRRPRPLAIDE